MDPTDAEVASLLTTLREGLTPELVIEFGEVMAELERQARDGEIDEREKAELAAVGGAVLRTRVLH